MNSASQCSLAGRYDNPIPTRCLAPKDFLKIPAQHDFSLAWLQAVGYFCEGGHGTTRNIRFKKGFVKCVLLVYPSTEFESTFNVY
jgi:hypothetical protein